MAKAKKKAAKKKASKKAGRKPAARSAEMLIVASKAKEALRGQDCNISADALEGLNSWCHWLIAQAAARAEANGRKTVRAHDFLVI